MITFTGYNNGSNPKKANKDLNPISGLTSLSLVLKEGCSVQNPVVLLRTTSDINKNLNYFYIEEFDRWYFITDVKAVRDDLIEITGKTDVLSTSYWRKDSNNLSRLGKCTGIVYRSESNQCYNLLLDDGYFKVKNNPKIRLKKFDRVLNSHSYVMMIAGT